MRTRMSGGVGGVEPRSFPLSRFAQIMASSQTRPASIPESFSPEERFLAEKTEEAIQDGAQLERWCRDPNRQIQEFLLHLKKEFALPNQPAGYFGHVHINGKAESIMGGQQGGGFSKV